MSATPRVEIAGRPIGPGHPPYVIAEMSANHNGKLDTALAIVDAAAEAGCDAIKMQTYRADTITIDASGPGFDITEGPWKGRTLFQLYDDAHMPWDWHAPIMARAAERGLAAFSAPFDLTAVAFLTDLGVPAFKIASYEIVDLDLIGACARTGKPLILSTGLASPEEVDEAVAAARENGCAHPIVLHCVSGYPTPYEEANLQRIAFLRERLPGCLIGLSDHTPGAAIPAGAAALGAHVIEKHITLDRSGGGEDDFFSLEPAEMTQVVDHARAVWAATRDLSLTRAKSEAQTAAGRRSLYVVKPVARGEAFTRDNIRSIRPGNGMAPRHLEAVLGRTATRDCAFGEPLGAAMVDGFEAERP